MPLWMAVVEWLARIILALLVFLSIWSIGVIFDRLSFFKKIDREREFENIKEKATKFRPENLEKGLSRHFFELQQKMQKGLSVLGTLGSITPFIGLFGTILGIIVAFGELSQGEAGTNAIMYALAEALILTAMGLFVAIPAVIAFNVFNKKSKSVIMDLQSRLDEDQSVEKEA